jgi:hypothetical protein
MKYQRTPVPEVTSKLDPNSAVVGNPWAKVTDVLIHNT